MRRWVVARGFSDKKHSLGSIFDGAQGRSGVQPHTMRERVLPSRAVLRQQKAEQRDVAVRQAFVKAKEGTYFGFALVGGVVALGALYTAMEYFYDGGSEYTVFSKAVRVLEESPEMEKELGRPLRYHAGERGGRFSGYVHRKGVDPTTGLSFCTVHFYVSGSGLRAPGKCLVIATMEQRRAFLFSSWKFTRLDVSVPRRGRSRPKTVHLVAFARDVMDRQHTETPVEKFDDF
jgi:hypothetical protein